MSIPRTPSPLRLSRTWLLWLALLWPLAQAVSGWHGYSHFQSGASRAGDSQAPHTVHCELCLMAADLGAAAPPATLAALPALVASIGLAPTPARGVWRAPAPHPYQGRAPPSIPA